MRISAAAIRKPYSNPVARDYYSDSDERVFGLDVQELIERELSRDADGGNVAVRVQQHDHYSTSVLYDCKCDNILTPENTRLMANIERRILQIAEWPSLCLAVSNLDHGCSSAAYTSFASQFA